MVWVVELLPALGLDGVRVEVAWLVRAVKMGVHGVVFGRRLFIYFIGMPIPLIKGNGITGETHFHENAPDWIVDG